MSFAVSLAVYFVLWFLALLAVLPFGVHTQDEAGFIVPGTPAGAPAAYRAKRVLGLATVVSLVAFVLVFALFSTAAGRGLLIRLFGDFSTLS